ncbi:SO_0444 family Cu/Zn efflux transporter [Verrucomicrobiota bacterium]
MDIVLALWETLCDMAPWLLFGFLVAGALSIFISPKLVEKHLGGRGIWPVFKASLFGVPLPLCSCGVIPVAASLRKHGSSKGATTAFLLSTPQTGVDSIMATFSLLGPVFAVFRPLAAFVAGMLGGAIVSATDDPNGEHAHTEECHDECCGHSTRSSKAARVFHYGFVTLPRDIARPLVLGLAIAGVIAVAVPEDFFAEALGTGFLAMIVMMLLGMPLYVCATASIPVAAAMMLKGVTPGAALVFLMTGPATNAVTIATLWKMLGRKTTLLYLAIVAGTALGSGLALDLLFDVTGISTGHVGHSMLPPWVGTLSALLLIAVLVPAVLPRKHEHDHEAEA